MPLVLIAVLENNLANQQFHLNMVVTLGYHYDE